MKRFHYLFVLTIGWVLLPSAVWAQEPGPTNQDALRLRRSIWEAKSLIADPTLSKKLSDGEQAQNASRAEDMEILAAIVRDNLDTTFVDAVRGFSDFHRNSSDPAFNHLGDVAPNGDVDRCGEPLAEYLSEVGIVIQMSIPAPQTQPTGKGKSDSVPTQWEMTKQHLRGEGDWIAKSQCERCHDGASANTPQLQSFFRRQLNPNDRPSLNTILHTVLVTLAENGHNVRDLKPQERITISLSYSQVTEPPPQKAPANPPEESPKNPAPDSPPTDATKPNDKASTEKSNTESGAVVDRAVMEAWLRKDAKTQPQSDIDRMTIRRMYLDALGRPPTAEELNALGNGPVAGAYDLLVHKLLLSPEADSVRAGWAHDTIRFTQRPARFPKRSRISVSLTKEQMDKAAAGKLPLSELMKVAQISGFKAK